MNMSAERTESRRAFLGALTGAAAVGLAGCSGIPSDGTDAEPGTGTETEAYRNGVGADASVSFAVPTDGTELTSRYAQWRATADGVTIEESGEVTEGAGHYHVLVETGPVTPGEVIPDDNAHVHYGTGQGDGVLELEPGEHTLHLQVADGEHRAMDLTDTVEVTVADEASLALDATADGSVVDWDVTAENYTIDPSSEGVGSNAGHLHAIIDADPVPVGEVIPDDARHVHFGDGATSGSLDLESELGDAYEPGEHTLHFQIGSGTHRATMIHAETTVTTE